MRTGAVQLFDSLGNALATTPLHGMGTGPVAAFVPGGAQSMVASGLNKPKGVTAHAAGNVYVADTSNGVAYKVPAGCATSACWVPLGSGLSAPSSIAVDGNGNAYISDIRANLVYEVPAGCSDPACQIALGSGLSNPYGLTLDGVGDLFVADTGNNRVVEIPVGCTTASCQITLLTGLNVPLAVAVDGAGNLYIADDNNQRVLKIPAGCTTTACQSTLGFGLSYPYGVAVDAAGDVFISDQNNGRVVEVPPSCTTSACQVTVATGLNQSANIALDGAGNLYIADANNNRIVEVSPTHATLSFAATNQGSTSAPQKVTIENIGNASLTFASFTASTNFVVDAGTTTCSSSAGIVPGASCNVGVACSPKSGGNSTGTLTITDNSLNAAAATQTVALACAGSGTAPAITSATSTTFVIGSPGTFTPAAGTRGIYYISFTASNGVGSPAVQNDFALTVDQAPIITSASSTSFSVGTAGNFLVTTVGTPLAHLSETGTLPTGVTFHDNGNSSATLSGTPAAGTGGVYNIVITAQNGISPNAQQNFTLTVNQAPAITSAISTTFAVGSPGTFTVTTAGTPTPSLSESGQLPTGVSFNDNGDGTGTLSGTPASGTRGIYYISFTASNGVGSPAVQTDFSLTVDQAPIITSASSTTFSVGTSGNFLVTTLGTPTAHLSESGTLPAGVTFHDNGNSSATLSGTPAAGTGDTYNILITAQNGLSPNAQQNFTLTVDQAPTITSGNSAAFTVGSSGMFTVTTTGSPMASLSESGALPNGVTFVDQGNGTAKLSGTPAAGGTYPITITAQNGISPNATQNFTLNVLSGLSISLSSLNFGTVYLNSHHKLTATVTN